MKNILITGADGFIGSFLFHAVETHGRVIGTTRATNASSDKGKLIAGSITNLSFLRDIVSRYEIDTIVHLAASTVLRQAYVDPLSCIQNNIIGTTNVLEVARMNPDVKRVVVATSDKAYGDAPVTPYTEDMQMRASDIYGTSKACADLLCSGYHKTYGIDVRVIRSGNVFGPGDPNHSRLIPASCIQLWQDKSPIVYLGAENHAREFVYIDDEINGYLTVLKKGKAGEAYNIGSPDRFTVYDMASKLCKVFKENIPHAKKLKPVIEHREFVEIKNQSLSTKKLEALGWKPSTSPIEEKLLETIKYYEFADLIETH